MNYVNLALSEEVDNFDVDKIAKDMLIEEKGVLAENKNLDFLMQSMQTLCTPENRRRQVNVGNCKQSKQLHTLLTFVCIVVYNHI